MTDIFLWGTGAEGIAERVEPDQLKEMALGRGLESNDPLWRPVSLISEGPESRCRVAAKKSRQSVFVTGPCSSSMNLAWYFHRQNLLSEWDSVLVSRQWTGRGQLGREWVSPAGNIYGTLRLPASAVSEADCLPVLVGYALIAALKRIGVNAKLKWPNDLVLNSKKVGGILIEDKGGVKMVGVGINLTSSPPGDALRSRNALPAACLKDFGHDDLTPLFLWQYLVNTGREFFNKIRMADLPELLAGLTPHLAFAGSPVWVEDFVTPPYEARLLGVSSDGGLQLLTSCGTTVVRSASIYPLDV
ncbi:biotin--acetyl-CoA-carboxylase ligase [Desulfoluna limicola]|uniref:Biotin--acetyl-CoA-carboxylase ligase n=1 Tax=Desulfoluna limicola TaxID=2810562 RepID=A0ABM7PJX6_9BACT|nr:biotin--[acetyl-CoA-carboxylase] ligase [Desulfoluna limicola]BCS97380.1 biotin--acetyl-CoA-carboxylase ligase [Desulfoluna limicola]